MYNNSTMKRVVLILVAVIIGSLAIAAVLIVQDGGISGFTNYSREGNELSSSKSPVGDTGENSSASNSQGTDEEQQESLSGVENININDVSENIKFIPVDSGDEIKAHFYSNDSSRKNDDNPKLVMSKSGNTVNIKIEYPKKLIINFHNTFKLDIYIPKTYSQNLKLSTTSANTEIDEMNLKSFKYNTISGKLTAKVINSEKTELHTTSGNSTINGSLGDFVFTTISGKFDSDDIKAEAARIEVTSGDVSIKGNPGKTTFKSISGKLVLDYTEKISADLTASQTSGNVTLKLPSDSEFGVDFRATSGKAKCDFPITVNGSQDDNKLNGTVGNASSRIKMSSISGDLRIEKK